jgi:hypothetical protein
MSATQQSFFALNLQRSAGVQQTKTAAVESFRIPQALPVAATIGAFRVWGRYSAIQ